MARISIFRLRIACERETELTGFSDSVGNRRAGTRSDLRSEVQIAWPTAPHRAAAQPQRDGNVRVDPAADRQEVASGAGLATACRTAEKYPRGRSDHGTDLGAGGSRSATLFLDWGCSQLLWLNLGVSIVGRQRATWPNLQTKKRLASDRADRSGQAGAAMEPAVGHTACQRIRTGPSHRATLQVARKLVAYLLAVDKSGQPFRILTPPPTEETSTKAKRRKRASMPKAA
jgi:hypothetical protein